MRCALRAECGARRGAWARFAVRAFDGARVAQSILAVSPLRPTTTVLIALALSMGLAACASGFDSGGLAGEDELGDAAGDAAALRGADAAADAGARARDAEAGEDEGDGVWPRPGRKH